MKRTKENVKVLKLKYDGEWVYELINESWNGKLYK